MTKSIAIVGMGVSGLAVLLGLSQLSKKQLAGVTIVCFDDKDHFGRGIPFQEDVDEALINSPIDTISFDYRDMGDFKAWLIAKGYAVDRPYVSRALYGQYMQERGQELLDQLPATVVRKRVDHLTYLSEQHQWQVHIDGEIFGQAFDELHLACGDLPTIDPYQLEGNSDYIRDPYPIKKLKDIIWKDSSVSLIGTGLAAVDVLKWLLNQPVARVFAFSRSGYFPTVRILDGEPFEWVAMTDDKFESLRLEDYFSIEEFEELLEKELQALGFQNWENACETYLASGIEGLRLAETYPEELYRLQALASRVADWFSDLWPRMTHSDRQEYKEIYEKAIINLRNPMPEESADVLIGADKSGRLVVLNQVTDVVANDEEFDIIQKEGEVCKVSYVINATGYHLTKANQKKATLLLQQLLDQHLVQIDDEGGLSVLAETAQIISPRYGTMLNLFAHGELINGVIYQNNSTVKIQQMAERAVAVSR
ncbi:FAD/NAD(P)-binding protein [Streptococcus moroccensis]|uniref:NAD(P)/FAD-binding protein YdhS n=1 Tax=Streptococcus moroccensis TaxID=1451356 RepID=A0ABT9YPP2_9STRE|nr:FAD/NAD(P)-binding protein [Streptococcus moroccensis]MDQ0221965.1 putative NAD(P)/FAD-binding protein YdhS [Streptococcus moroccensis]